MESYSKKIKIAFMTDKIDNKPEKTTFPRQLIERLLMRNDFEVYLLHYDPQSEDSLYKRANEVIIPKVSFFWGAHFISFIKFCLTTKLKFDIFFIFVGRPYPFFWLIPAKKKIVMAHGGGSVTAPGIITVPNLIFNFILKHFNKYIDAIIGVSEFGSREIVYAYRALPDRVVTIYPALDSVYKYRRLSQKEISDTFARYKIKVDKYFLYVGGLQPHKNANGLIKAYILLRRKYPEIKEKLIIAAIHSKQQLEVFYREIKLDISPYKEDIIFTGYIELKDMPVFHGCATALVFPSLNEGFGMPVIEAMACGNPVITSDTVSLPEVAGDAAILVNPLDSEDIMNAMKELSTNNEKRKELIKRGFERVKFFTWEKCMEKYISLFKKNL